MRDNWHRSRFSLHRAERDGSASSHAGSAILHRVDTMTRRNLAGALAVGATLWLSGCGDSATAPVDHSPAMTSANETAAATAEVAALAAEVRQLAAAQGITPLAGPPAVRP